MRNIKIRRVMNGFVVGVGCQDLVFETSEKLLGELKRYLDSPEVTEEEYTAQYGLANSGDYANVAAPSSPYPTPAYPVGYAVGGTYEASPATTGACASGN